ncbi:MAG TPA: glycosyltransferase [Pseudomonas sp.]|uniref:glycosyltransferase n=1 Tax=Pseudomonas sp. TaxID=306 RepID=UPI002B488084|nr:glycosyltransferase [Pseudomonas sp.]HKS11862.1 glycosyltransferase [Pseudomonas sp.]
MNSPALVSIIIPAYKPQFFEKALISAMLQDYEHVEIVICDDCRDDSIARIVECNRSKSPFEIRYFYNETPLLEPGNLARGISEARGEYVKFLYDDDLLMPDAVSALLAALEAHPQAVMASARRRMIDENDQPYGESLLTIFPFRQDVIIRGDELASFLGQHIYNFIGEPTSVMCRRSAVLGFGAQIMSLGGQLMEWVGDLAMYVKLLRQGDLVMLGQTLGCFRISALQTSQTARDRPQIATVPFTRFRDAVSALGWMRPAEQNATVKVATLAQPTRFHELNLADYFGSGGVLPMGNADLQAWRHPSAYVTPVRDWLAQRTLTPVQQRLIERHREQIAGIASICVLVLAGDGAKEALRTTLASLECWAANTSTRLEWQVVERHQPGWVARLNEALDSSDKEWLMLLQAGDELVGSGTLLLDQTLPTLGETRLVYCDELYRGVPDLRIALRPGVNLDYLLSLPAVMAGHWLVRRELVARAGGFDPAMPGALELDLILRLIEAEGLEGIHPLAEPLVLRDAPEIVEQRDEIASLQRHLTLRGYPDARVSWGEDQGGYQIRYHHAERPTVSIMIWGGYSLAMLQRCLESLLANTRYPSFEIIVVEPQAVEASTHDWLSSMEQIGGGKIRVVQSTAAMRPAAINSASEHALGEFLLLLDGDTVAIEDDWLDRLLNHGQRPEVGGVAGTLVSASGRVLQTGLVAGLRGSVGPAFDGPRLSEAGYLHRLVVDQNFSAVPSACLLVRRDRFLGVGGFDEGLASGPYGDFDLCLKIAESGCLFVWTPHAVLVQHEQTSAPPAQVDEEGRHARWLEAVGTDPAYNPNCTLRGAAFELEANAELTWRPLKWRPLPVVLACPSMPREALESRIITPMNALREAGLIDGALSSVPLELPELRRHAPDVVVFQDNLAEVPLEAMREARKLGRVFIVLEVAEFLSTSATATPLDPLQRWESLSQAVRLADRVIVPTTALAQALAPLQADVRVLQTRLGREWLDLPFNPQMHPRPRIGCFIQPSTSLDADMLAAVVRALADRVDWVLWGEVPDALRACACEVHDAAPHMDPQALAGLRLDLALAPLGASGLDSCSSALALLLYGACGYGVICSDSPAYDNALQVTRTANTPEAWIDAIERQLRGPQASRQQAWTVREQVRRDWVFDEADALDWAQAWTAR